jgi:uncharacterized membrane protein
MFCALNTGYGPERCDASKVVPADKLSLVVAMILAVIFLGEAVTARHWISGLSIVLGAIVIAWK